MTGKKKKQAAGSRETIIIFLAKEEHTETVDQLPKLSKPKEKLDEDEKELILAKVKCSL